MQSIDKIEELLSNKSAVLSHVEKENKKFDELQDILSKEKQIYTEVAKNVSGKADGQVLLNCNPVNSYGVLVALSKRIIENSIKPVIILTSTNQKSAKVIFEKEGVAQEDVFFIDTVSKNIIDVSDGKNVLFVDSLRNLTQIQIKMINIMRDEKNVAFIFDSLNVLELYHSDAIIMKFTYAVSKLLKKNRISGYYLMTKSAVTPKMSQFFDNFVEIKKIE
jgi:hypothetical protein